MTLPCIRANSLVLRYLTLWIINEPVMTSIQIPLSGTSWNILRDPPPQPLVDVSVETVRRLPTFWMVRDCAQLVENVWLGCRARIHMSIADSGTAPGSEKKKIFKEEIYKQ